MPSFDNNKGDEAVEKMDMNYMHDKLLMPDLL